MTAILAGVLVSGWLAGSPTSARPNVWPRCRVALSLSFSSPSQAEAEAMGIRDWPQTFTSDVYIDECDAGARRYVLEGTGSVCIVDGGEPVPIAPNSLVTVDSAATLRWSPDGELILLTPEYKGPNLLPIAAGLVVLTAGLFAIAGSG